jgi:hypothetical protein
MREKSSMMQTTKPSPVSSEDRFARARGDLALAKALLPQELARAIAKKQ